MMKLRIFIFCCILAMVSCAKQSLETTYSTQESRIDSFISSLTSSDPNIRVVRNNGANRIILNEVQSTDDSGDGTGSEDGTGTDGSGSGDGTDTDGSTASGPYGEEVTENGTVSFYYAGYVFNGSAPRAASLFATNHEDTAIDAGWELSSSDYNILTVSLNDADALVPGLRNGLVGVRAGEICYIVFTGKYGFGDKVVGTIPANSALLYHVWVESINND